MSCIVSLSILLWLSTNSSKGLDSKKSQSYPSILDWCIYCSQSLDSQYPMHHLTFLSPGMLVIMVPPLTTIPQHTICHSFLATFPGLIYLTLTICMSKGSKVQVKWLRHISIFHLINNKPQVKPWNLSVRPSPKPCLVFFQKGNWLRLNDSWSRNGQVQGSAKVDVENYFLIYMILEFLEYLTKAFSHMLAVKLLAVLQSIVTFEILKLFCTESSLSNVNFDAYVLLTTVLLCRNARDPTNLIWQENEVPLATTRDRKYSMVYEPSKVIYPVFLIVSNCFQPLSLAQSLGPLMRQNIAEGNIMGLSGHSVSVCREDLHTCCQASEEHSIRWFCGMKVHGSR